MHREHHLTNSNLNLKSMKPNLRHGCASRRHFQFLVLVNFDTEWFVLSPHHRKKNFPLSVAGGMLHGPQILAVSITSLSHVWVLLKDSFDGPWGVDLGILYPLHVSLCLGTIDTQFYPQTIP